MMEWLFELKDNVDRHGIRWGLVFTLYAIFRRERRNHRLDQRDAAMFHNLKIIMDTLEVGDQWRGTVRISEFGDRLNYKKLFSSLHKDTQQGNQRRKTKMNNQNINYKTLVPTLIMGAKVVLDHFGYHIITDASINTWVTDISTFGALVGIVLPHTKASAISETVVQALPDIQNTIHKVIADPNTSYAKMVPVITEVHTTLTALFEDMKKGKVTDATREAMSAYLTFQAYLQTIKPAAPVESPAPIPSVEQVGA